MTKLRFDDEPKKKVRGLKRRYKEIKKVLKEETESVPNPNNFELGYWHIHLPFSQDYINSKKTPNKFRRNIMQLLIDRVDHLIDNKKEDQSQYRVFAIIYLPNLFFSQLDVVPYSSWFNGYFDRNRADQRWISLDNNRTLGKEWHLTVPSYFDIKGFQEIITEDEETYENEIWFLDELR